MSGSQRCSGPWGTEEKSVVTWRRMLGHAERKATVPMPEDSQMCDSGMRDRGHRWLDGAWELTYSPRDSRDPRVSEQCHGLEQMGR